MMDQPPKNHQRRLVKCRTFDNSPPFYWVEEWWTECTCPDCRAEGHWHYLAQYPSSQEEEARETANFPIPMHEEIVRDV